MPIGVILLVAGARALPHGRGEPGRTVDLPGLALLTPAVLAFVLPLVLGQPEHWPVWGWIVMAASVPLVAVFVRLTFAPTAAAFALVSLNWRRLPARWHGTLIIGGFVSFGAGIAVLAALLVGVATFGTLYLNLAGRLPGHAALGAFRPVSAHAEAVTLLALAGLAAIGVTLAAIYVLERRRPPA